MIARVRTTLLAVALAASALTASAADLSEGEEARAREIGKSLRCVVCQNQSIEDSNAPLAADMRQLVRERIEAGDSDDAIVDHLVDRYGTFVLMRPPVRSDTYLLWFGPLIFAIAAGVGCYFYLRSSRGPQEAPQPLDEAEAEALRRKLEGEKAS